MMLWTLGSSIRLPFFSSLSNPMLPDGTEKIRRVAFHHVHLRARDHGAAGKGVMTGGWPNVAGPATWADDT